jgi:phosphoenolpyruvate phosphomutase
LREYKVSGEYRFLESTMRSRELRKLLLRPEIAKCAGAHNAIGARLACMVGFDAVWSSSFEVSASFCLPDASILSMSDYLNAARSIASSVTAPVIADCDTGYGNALNVAYAVRAFEKAGVAGISIEDQVFPKLNSLIDGAQQLVPVAEFASKIRAGKKAQSDPAFVIIARVEALIAGRSLSEALSRAHTYAEAGADAILMHWNKADVDPIAQFLSLWKIPVPVIVVPTTYYAISATELQRLGAAMVIYANQGLRSSLPAMENTFRAILHEGNTASIESSLWPVSRIISEFQEPILP